MYYLYKSKLQSCTATTRHHVLFIDILLQKIESNKSLHTQLINITKKLSINTFSPADCK